MQTGQLNHTNIVMIYATRHPKAKSLNCWLDFFNRETGYIILHPAKKVKEKIKRGSAYYYY